jgi:DNA polymerase delta subunit 1
MEYDLEEEYVISDITPFVDGDEVKELEEQAENLQLTDSDNDEEEELPVIPKTYCKNNTATSDEEETTLPPVKLLRNFNEVLGVGKHVDLPQAKRNARKKKKLIRKQQRWEEKVRELEAKTKALKAPYLRKSIKDFRKLIQRDNPFKTPAAWLPPKWTPGDPNQESVTLQLVDIDDITSTAEQWPVRWRPTDLDTTLDFDREHHIPEHERANMEVKVIEGREQRNHNKSNKKPQHSVPVLRMHCLDTNGCPVMVRVHAFRPYFYARVPTECQSMSNSWLCGELSQYLEQRLEKDSFVQGQKVISVSIEQAQSVMGFHFERLPDGCIVSKKDRFFKITLSMPALVQNCKNILQPYKKTQYSGASIRNEHDMSAPPLVQCLDLFECEKTLPFTFITDYKLPGQTWFSLPAMTYEVITDPVQRKTNYKVEIDTRYDTIQVHDSAQDQYSSIAPIRIISFDIECAANGHFPKAERDPVISIAVVVQDCTWKTPPLQAVFTYKINKEQYDPCWKTSKQRNNVSPKSKHSKIQLEHEDQYMYTTAGNTEECMEDDETDNPNDVQLDDAEIWMCQDEEDMLLSFSEFMRDCAPGVLTGYNSNGFDIPYLLNRALALDLEGFPFWGATLEPVLPEYSMFSSSGSGQQERVNVEIPGMILYDFLRWIRPEIKLKSYTLNSVAEYLLKQTKDDLHYSLISRMFYGPAHARRRLFKYNLKDAILPLLMIKNRLSWMRDSEMSRVCNVVIKWLTNRGQGVKTMSQLQPRMKAEHLLRPYTPKPPRSANADGSKKDKFSGADVLEPKTGLHRNPVATLDYNSLYPTILITYNICYTTMIRLEDLHLLSPEDYNTVTIDEKTGEKRYFVKKHIREGLLPKILVNLLGSRAKAKTEMKAAQKALDQLMYEVLDSRQLALKVSANR